MGRAAAFAGRCVLLQLLELWCYLSPLAHAACPAAASPPSFALHAACLPACLHHLPSRCSQFPKLYEAECIRLVHHSLEDASQLCDAILAHLATRFVAVSLLLLLLRPVHFAHLLALPAAMCIGTCRPVLSMPRFLACLAAWLTGEAAACQHCATGKKK